MQPTYVFTDGERDEVYSLLANIPENPYQDYPAFSRVVATLCEQVPDSFSGACRRIQAERTHAACDVHVLRNCPIDAELPALGNDDPLGEKYKKKKTFIAEAFLELFAQLTGTPLLSYEKRFNGDFFCDVIAHDKYHGQQTGFAAGDLVYHNDRTAHPIRADFISLLGMRCPEDLVYTSFVSGRSLLNLLTSGEQDMLRQPWYITPFDVLSRDNNRQLTTSGVHLILENAHSFRYLDTHTRPAPGTPSAAKDAIIALKNALTRATKARHRILVGDLLTFANQDGLHNREEVEVVDPSRVRNRWLLKTYAFRDQDNAAKFAAEWVGGIAGRVSD